MKKKYVVTLTEEERQMLREMVSRGKSAARKLTHARVLLKADQNEGGPSWEDAAIAQGLEVGRATVERVRKRFVKKDWKRSWTDADRNGNTSTDWMATARPICSR